MLCAKPWNSVSGWYRSAMHYASLVELLSRFHSTRVLVLGDVMLDRYIYGTAERISPEAPIPVMMVRRTSDMPGGAANVARNIATLGAHVTLIGVAGRDNWARDLDTQLSNIPTLQSE